MEKITIEELLNKANEESAELTGELLIKYVGQKLEEVIEAQNNIANAINRVAEAFEGWDL